MRTIRIGQWTVVPSLNVLRHGDESIKLEPRAMDLLVYLARARQRVVSADELLREVWQGRVFDDGIVYRKVNQLRKALGDDPQQPRFIETISKRGYRLIAEVTDETATDGQPTAGDTAPAPAMPVGRSTRQLMAIIAVGAVLAVGAAIGFVALSDREPAEFVIAVLPCENLSPDTERGFFASGIQEALIDQLAALGFGVIGRAAVMSYAESTEPLAAVARSLNADAVMECSVRYADDRVRIAVALLDGGDGTTLWRRPYEGEFADYFAIESKIASSVAHALGATITPRRAAADKIASRSARAIEFYFSARRYEELGVTSWSTAASQYERAVAEDPGFARAFAQLSLTRTGLYLSVEPVRENLDKARAAAEEALRLDPELAHGRVAMLTYAIHSRTKPAAAVAEELVTLEQDAQGVSEFFLLRGVVNQRLGRWEDALADITKAVALGQPRNVPLLVIQGLAHQQLRQYEKTAEVFDRVADIAPDDWGSKCHRAVLALVSAGDTLAARTVLHDVPLTAPLCGALVTAALMDGDYDTALRWVEMSPLPPADPRRQAQTGTILRLAGRDDEARPLFKSALDGFTGQLANAPLEAQPALKLMLARLSVYLGETEVALRYSDEVMASLNDAPPGVVPDLRLTAAAVYALAGANDFAIAELDRYLSSAGQWSIDGLARHPDFRLLSTDARFAAFREKYPVTVAHDNATEVRAAN